VSTIWIVPEGGSVYRASPCFETDDSSAEATYQKMTECFQEKWIPCSPGGSPEWLSPEGGQLDITTRTHLPYITKLELRYY